jgi:hypothetical protein
MPPLEKLQLANQSNWLWPPIEQALDTFLRRRAKQADAYERIWRLIHLWEAISLTLVAAGMSRLRESNEQKTILRKCREYAYGRSWNPLNATFEPQQGAGALDGSIDRWIDILFEISRYDYPDRGFLSSLKRFLDSEQILVGPFAQAWGLACDVPPDACKTEQISVKQALRHVNTFRNRFAHVPFPYDPLEALAEALESTTEQLFAVPPEPSKHLDSDGSSSPLTGVIIVGQHLLRGSTFFASSFDPCKETRFMFPCLGSSKTETEIWPTAPFILVDAIMRPHILTRLRNINPDSWEYTRFRAEAHTTITRDDLGLLDSLPPPTKSEYLNEEEVEEVISEVKEEQASSATNLEIRDAPTVSTFSDAILAIRNEKYDPAIEFLEEFTGKRPEYHIGWLRLGHAKREKAVRIRLDDPQIAGVLLRDAIDDLSRATEHRDLQPQARAFYERSKAHYHLSFLADDADREKHSAHSDATEACRRSSDTKYQTWHEYLDRMMGQLDHTSELFEGTRQTLVPIA